MNAPGVGPRWPVAVLGPFPPYRGGIAHHTALLVRTLLSRHDVTGLSFTRLYPGFLFPGRTQFDAGSAALVPPACGVRRVVDSIAPHTWMRAAHAVTRAGCRLLVVQWWHPFFAPAYASIARLVRRRGVRVVYVCHNVLPHEPSRVDGALVRLGLGAADAHIVHSAGDRDTLERLLPGRPLVLVPLPVFDFFAAGRIDRAEARRVLQVAGPVALFFGLVRPYKGLDVLLQALALVRRRLPLQLLVVGEFYEPRGPYDALVERLGLAQAVRFVDRYVPNGEVETYFQAADVVVLPYKSATQSAIVQIALSFERPAIVTRVGGLPESVHPGRTGDVVPPEDPEALAQALLAFYADGGLEARQAALRGAASAFGWEAMDATVHAVAAQLGLPVS